MFMIVAKLLEWVIVLQCPLVQEGFQRPLVKNEMLLELQKPMASYGKFGCTGMDMEGQLFKIVINI